MIRRHIVRGNIWVHVDFTFHYYNYTWKSPYNRSAHNVRPEALLGEMASTLQSGLLGNLSRRIWFHGEYLHFLAECYTTPLRRIWSSGRRHVEPCNMPYSSPHHTCACVNFTRRPVPVPIPRTHLAPPASAKVNLVDHYPGAPAAAFITIYCKFNGLFIDRLQIWRPPWRPAGATTRAPQLRIAGRIWNWNHLVYYVARIWQAELTFIRKYWYH